MIKHIVFWNIQPDLDRDKTALEIKTRLEALPAMIDVIRELEVGLDFNRSEAACDVSLYTAFNSREDLAVYQKHPAHVEVAGYIKSVVGGRHVVDYEV